MSFACLLPHLLLFETGVSITTTSNRRGMSVEGQLAIFLKIVGENTSNRMAQERFQRSGDTISRAFNKVLDAMVELYTAIVKQSDASQPTPPRIRNNPKMLLYQTVLRLYLLCIDSPAGLEVDSCCYANK